MVLSFWTVRICLGLITVFGIILVTSDIEFCYKGTTHRLVAGSGGSWGTANCPGGLLFKEPVSIFAVRSSNRSAFCIKENICEDRKWECGRQLQSAKVQYLSHLPSDSDQWDFVDSKGFLDKDISACGPPNEISDAGSRADTLLSRSRRSASEESPETFPAEETYTPPPQKLVDQTKRMFYFLSHLNPESVKSPLRAVALLEKTAQLVETICDPNFLNPLFMKEILRGFLFLLKEQGTERVMDVNEDDFELLTRALDACATNPNPLTLGGESCASKIHVETVKRLANGKETEIAYTPTDQWTFKWNMYDPVVDAVWFAVNIVHGMCFATFRQNINLHHKYQVAMEELFKNEILFRWTRPVSLFRNYEYDHIFLGPVNKSLQVLDACTEGSYISSPFLHRLKRPTDLRESTRMKRSVFDTEKSLDLLQKDAICLHSEERRVEAVKKLKESYCQ